MKAKIKQLFERENAVSPVIGVILMVAITVILAAVIGAFVLGMGDSLEETAQAKVAIDSISADSNTIELTHKGGDELFADEVDLRVEIGGTAETYSAVDGTASAAGFSTGDTLTITIQPTGTDDTISVDGDNWHSNDLHDSFSEGTRISVTIIDAESGQIIAEVDGTA